MVDPKVYILKEQSDMLPFLFFKVNKNLMILLHCYGKQVVQITEETLLGAVATFHLRDSICGSFSSQEEPQTSGKT